MKRNEIAVILNREMKDNIGVSINDLMKISEFKDEKPAKIYLTLMCAIKANMVDYTEKRGKERLFKKIAGTDFSKIVFGTRGRKAKVKQENPIFMSKVSPVPSEVTTVVQKPA